MFWKSFIAMAACALLAGCGALTGTAPVTSGVPPVASATSPTAAPAPAPKITMATVVSGLQSFNGGLQRDAANWLLAHPADAAIVAKVEATLNPEIAGLTGDVLPVTLSGVLTDVRNAVNALPAGALSAAHKAELDLLIGGAQFFLADAGPPTVTKILASADALPAVALVPVAPVAVQELAP